MSEGIDALIDAEGFAGYGRWSRILEIVAFKMDETNRCHVEYSIQKWCRLLGLKQKKLISFLELTENELKTKVVYSGNIIRIEIPNLLKKRDNYTKNLQVKDKQLASKEVDKKEIKKKKKENKPLVFDFESIWKRYPNKDGKKEAERHFKASVKIEEDWTDINKALDNYKVSEKVKKGYVKNGSTWFNNWRDWIEVQTAQSKTERRLEMLKNADR